MRRITFLLTIFMLTINFTFAGINTSTAWFNNQDFTSYTAGSTDLTSTFGITKGNAGLFYCAVTTTSTATNSGNALCFSRAAVTPFVENGNASNCTKFFTSDNSASGTKIYNGRFFYLKTSFYHCTTGTNYTLRNSEGNTVFQFGGVNSSSGPSVFTTGNAQATIGLGKRAQWSDIEFILDLSDKKVVKCNIANNSLTNKSYTFSDLALTVTGSWDIKSLYINTATSGSGFTGAGFDNATIGELEADNIKTLSGAASLQTLTSGALTSDYSVAAFTSAMGLDLVIPKTDLNVVWSISDYGTLTPTDQALVTLTRSATDFTVATLSAGNISADATITLQAVYGATTLTKTVVLTAASIDGLKATLQTAINTGTASLAAVTDSNPYIASAKSTFSGVLTTSQGVHDNPVATAEEIGTAISNTESANTAFANAMNPYNSYIAYIATVQAGHDAEVRVATFYTAVKSVLNSAISAANTAKTTVTTTGDITTAQAALSTAFAQFNADIPAYSNLQAQIASVSTRITFVTPRRGEGTFLMFIPATVDALTDAKTAAEIVLANGTTALELTTSQAMLATALTTFNAAPRVAPSSTEYYRIYTYGTDGGDGNTEKKILYIDGTTGILKYQLETHNTSIANKYWRINEVSTGKFTFLNKNTATYLNGSVLSETPMEFSLPENTSQSGANSIDDGYFLYSIVNPSARGLEVDVYDSGTSTGVFISTSAPANRLRFSYQFEIVSTFDNVNNNSTLLKAYAGNNKIIIDGINLGENYTIYNSNGLLIYKGLAKSTRIEVPVKVSGLYIVKTNDDAIKIRF